MQVLREWIQVLSKCQGKPAHLPVTQDNAAQEEPETGHDVSHQQDGNGGVDDGHHQHDPLPPRRGGNLLHQVIESSHLQQSHQPEGPSNSHGAHYKAQLISLRLPHQICQRDVVQDYNSQVDDKPGPHVVLQDLPSAENKSSSFVEGSVEVHEDIQTPEHQADHKDHQQEHAPGVLIALLPVPGQGQGQQNGIRQEQDEANQIPNQSHLSKWMIRSRHAAAAEGVVGQGPSVEGQLLPGAG
mmetsp:Transcript_94328/g.224674  ORF Transcript_94328/g.224674 Transcript_94328/m.224674 type:complete len:241 (-) Transcript_94328:66-788(-)